LAKALYGFQTGRIFCANSPSQQASRALYNLLLLLRKNGLFYHRSEGYGPPSSSVRLKSIKSLGKKAALWWGEPRPETKRRKVS